MRQDQTKIIVAAQSIDWFERPFCYFPFNLLLKIGLVLFLTACASTPEPSPKLAHTPTEDVLNQIWSITHTDELFESLPLKMPIQEMLDDRFREFPTDYQAQILKLLDKNMEPSKLQRMLKSHLLKNFKMKKAKDVLAFYQEPLGTFYGAAGHQFDPQDPAFQTFVEGAQPSPKRLEQLAELLTASGSAKFASLTLITPIETIFLELEHQKKLAGQKPHKEPVSELRKSMQSVVKAMHKAMLLTASFVYRELSDEEMKNLIQFENTRSAKWYNTTLLKAYEKTLQISMKRFTRQLLKFIQEEPPGTNP